MHDTIPFRTRAQYQRGRNPSKSYHTDLSSQWEHKTPAPPPKPADQEDTQATIKPSGLLTIYLISCTCLSLLKLHHTNTEERLTTSSRIPGWEEEEEEALH